MKCPFCESKEMIVSNSRETGKGLSIWRRRKCIHCLNTFTTYEEINLNYIIVIKKNSSKERYSHYKLFSSIFNSFLKIKKIDTGDCAKKTEVCVNEIERDIVKRKVKEITTKNIFNVTLQNLLDKDIRAALNYFSYFYPNSKNEEMEKLLKNYSTTFRHKKN